MRELLPLLEGFERPLTKTQYRRMAELRDCTPKKRSNHKPIEYKPRLPREPAGRNRQSDAEAERLKRREAERVECRADDRAFLNSLRGCVK